ncbi:MAG: hypothetical protein JSW73_01555 [Candidatus Woesearchaeota archaeon]|nr:MAG: hypothetical protein JSW73_01555 [Candidatus Woesearchaeota archaeon]
MNRKRIAIAVLIAALFGAFCAYGTSTIEIPGFEMTVAYLSTIFYARLLLGVFVGIGDNIKILKGTYKNAALRGAIFGILTSIVISFYGGAVTFIGAGIIYGIITDLLATRFSK